MTFLRALCAPGQSRPCSRIVTRDNRDVIRDEARRHPRSSAFFWLALELPVQVPLILAVLAIPSDLGEAYYTTALVFNLFQAAFVMAQFVYAKVRAGS